MDEIANASCKASSLFILRRACSAASGLTAARAFLRVPAAAAPSGRRPSGCRDVGPSGRQDVGLSGPRPDLGAPTAPSRRPASKLFSTFAAPVSSVVRSASCSGPVRS